MSMISVLSDICCQQVFMIRSAIHGLFCLHCATLIGCNICFLKSIGIIIRSYEFCC